MPQTNTNRGRSLSDAYWRKRYAEAGVVSKPGGGGVTVTKPTNRLGFDDRGAKEAFIKNNYLPIAKAIENGDSRVVNSQVMDVARYGLQQGYLRQDQASYIFDNVTKFRKALSTPVTIGGQGLPFTRLGQTGARGNIGEVQDTLKHSDLIRYNPDGSWLYDPTNPNDTIRANASRQQGLIKDATRDTGPNLGATALGAVSAVPLRVAKSFGYNPTFDEGTFGGKVGLAAEGFEAGLASAVPNFMSGISNRTRYGMSRLQGRSPEEAEADAAALTTETPWYQFSNKVLEPAQTSPNFQIGSVFGQEAATAVPALYTSLGLLNASATLGGRMLAPFGSAASNIGRYGGIATAVAAPPTITAFRDQLTGGKPGVAEDVVSGVETAMDPIRTLQQRGVSESQSIGQQEFDPNNVYGQAAQKVGLLTMASGGAASMWKDVKDQAAKGMFTFRGSLKETGNPFVAAKTGIAATMETEIGKAAAADLGFALTQPLGDIGRLVYSQTRLDKSKPYNAPKPEELLVDTLMGLVASRPGKNAQWIFRGNPLERLEPKTMALATAADIVNAKTPEISYLRKRFEELRGPNVKPNEADLRRVASAMARENQTNLETLGRMEAVPEGVAIHRTTEEHVKAYVENPDSIGADVRSRYDTLLENVRADNEAIDIADDNPLNRIDIDEVYKNDLLTRRRRINELAKTLLPEYQKMFDEMKAGKTPVKADAQFYGIDRGDGTIMVYNRDFTSQKIIPSGEYADIEMLRPNRMTAYPMMELTPERRELHRSLVSMRENTVNLNGVDLVPIGFTKGGILFKDGTDNIVHATLEKLQEHSRKAGEENKVELQTEINNLVELAQKVRDSDSIQGFPEYGRRTVSDERFPILMRDVGPDVYARLIDRVNGYGVLQSADGDYFIVPADQVRDYPVEKEIINPFDSDFDSVNNRITLYFSNLEGELYPTEVRFSPEQVATLRADGMPNNPRALLSEALVEATPFTRNVGDIVTLTTAPIDGSPETTRKYVIVSNGGEFGMAVPLDNVGDVPVMLFDHPELKVERANIEFLLNEMQQAQRITGLDAGAIRPTDDPINSIFKYAFWLSAKNTNSSEPIRLIPAIIDSTADELPNVLHAHILGNLDDTGVLPNVVASMREWLAKNPESAGDFEFIINRALQSELVKSADDMSILAVGHLTNIAHNADLNDLVDILIGSFDTDRPVGSEAFFSSSPRRIGRAQGEFRIMLSAVNAITTYIRKKGRISDERLTNMITNFLGRHPAFEGNLETTVTTIKRLTQLASSINHLAYGVISEKGAIWMMEKLSVLPHEVQVLSALLPFEDMSPVYQSDFGNWHTSKTAYEAAVTRARELYADAATRGEAGIDDLRTAMYDARLGFFFELAAGGTEIIGRRSNVDVTDATAVDVIRANAQRANNAVGEMIKRVATAKLAVLADQLKRNTDTPDLAIPVRLDEVATSAMLAAPDGVLHPEGIYDTQAIAKAAAASQEMTKLVDNVRSFIDDVDTQSVLPGVTVNSVDDALVGPHTLQTAQLAHEERNQLNAAIEAFAALPVQARDVVAALASPILWFADVVKAVERSGDNNIREALIFALINAQGTEGSSTLPFTLNRFFRTEEDFNRFNDHATVLASKVSSGDTQRSTAIRGAMDQLLKLVDSMITKEVDPLEPSKSLLDDALEYYSAQGIQPAHIKTFIEFASKELITGLIKNATRISADGASDVLGSINNYVASNRERIRRAGVFMGERSSVAEAMQIVESASTDGLKYLGVTFDGSRRSIIQDAVKSLIVNMNSRRIEGNSMQQAQMLLADAQTMAAEIADFVLGDKGLEIGQDPAVAYTPAVEVRSDSLIDALRSGMQFIKTGVSPEKQSLLMAGNRAGLEKIILTTLLDAASKAELDYADIDKALMEAVVGPDVARQYFERVKQEDYVKRKILFDTNPTMRAAIIPGVDGTYTLPTGSVRSEIVEGQAMFNSFVTKMLNLIKPRDKQKFMDAMSAYVNTKRAESGNQLFVFTMSDLMAIAEGFNETRGVLFRASADASELSYGVTNRDAHNAAYKVKARLASIVRDAAKPNVPNRFSVESQFTNLEGTRSFIDNFDAVDVYEQLPDDVVTMNDAEALGTLYAQMSKDATYTDQQKSQFATLAKNYRSMARRKDDAPTKVINRYSDARVVASNLAKVYDTYAARMSTKKISTDLEFNYDLDEYKALSSLLGIDALSMSNVLNATSVKEIFTDSVLGQDQQRQLIALRAAQLKQDFYNQHHKLFFAHEAMMSEMGYSKVQSGDNVDGFIVRTKIANAASSILFMAASKNFGKSALTISHEISHHLYFALPDAQQLRWVKAVIPPLGRKKDEKVTPEEELVHAFLNKQTSRLREFNQLGDENAFTMQRIEDFARAEGIQDEQLVYNAKKIIGESAATSMMNFILQSGVVHNPNDRLSVAEDLTSSLVNLQRVLAPIAKSLSSEYGPYAMVGGKPTNVFYYSPSSVLVKSPSVMGVTRAFYPMKHGSFVHFINDVGKKFSTGTKVVDIHDVIMSNKDLISDRGRDALVKVLDNVITNRDVVNEIADKLLALSKQKDANGRTLEYGKHYRISLSGNEKFVKQDPNTADEQGYPVTGRVVGIARERVTANRLVDPFKVNGKDWFVSSRKQSDGTQWYGLGIVDMTSGLRRMIQSQTRGDYGYVVESTAQVRLHTLYEGKDVDLGDNKVAQLDVPVRYIVGHDYIDTSRNFHMVGSGDAGNPSFMSILYNMMAKIDQNVLNIAGQRTYEYELRVNAALAEAMRTGDYTKWDEVVSVPLAMSLDKDIKNIVARTPQADIRAVQQTATHPWLRNKSHSRNLYRWARNIKDDGRRATALGLIDRITEQHAFTVGNAMAGDRNQPLGVRLQNIIKSGKGWYSFIPFSADKLSQNGITPIINAVFDQSFRSYGELVGFYNDLVSARAELFSDPSATSLIDVMNKSTELVPEGVTAAPKRSFLVDIDGVKVDAGVFFDQMFGLHVENFDQAFQQFQAQWIGTQLTKWFAENNEVVTGTTRTLSQRIAELHQDIRGASAASAEGALVVAGETPAPAGDVYRRSGLSKTVITGGKEIDLDLVIRQIANGYETPEQFEYVMRAYANSSDIKLKFSAETGLKVLPHAVLDHISSKVFTNESEMLRFMQAVAGDVDDNVTLPDVIRARNLFNTVEHIVRTDAKIRNAALRNWKSYELVSTDIDKGEVIIRSPDRDIAADEVGASKSGALYRINMKDGKTHLVAPSRTFDSRTNKWVETYENIQDVDDYLKYNWTRKPNEVAKKDPYAFDAKPNGISIGAKELLGTDNFDRVSEALVALAGERAAGYGYLQGEPIYFMLPMSVADIAETGVSILDPDIPTSNNGMHIIKGTYDKKDAKWSFVDTGNNWQNADNYRTQMPIGLMDMVLDPFAKSSAMTVVADKRQGIINNKMLQEEYHIAKLLLARDRNSDTPKHSDFNKIGQKMFFNNESDLMQDASTGTWFSSSPRYFDGEVDSIPELKPQTALHINDAEDPYIESSKGVYDDLAVAAKERAYKIPQTITYQRDPKTKGGIMQSGGKDNVVLQVSSDIFDKTVLDPLKGTKYETTVKDGEAITLDGKDNDVYFSSSPKLNEAAHNVWKYGLSPLQQIFRGVLGLDASSFAIQLGSLLARAPYQTFKALALSLPSLATVSSSDMGLVLGSLWHSARHQRRLAGGNRWQDSALNLDARYYDFIMNHTVDRFNAVHQLSTPISMSELVDTYYMQSSYSDWYKRSKANMLASPSRYKTIIDTPWESERENNFTGGILGATVPMWRRADMTRQLILDLSMLQQALFTVKRARERQLDPNSPDLQDYQVDRDIKARLMLVAKEIGIGSHAKSQTQAPIWRALSSVVQYFMTAPAYTRNFNQYWGFSGPGTYMKKGINEWAKVATAKGPSWLRGEVFDIESDLRMQKYGSDWATQQRVGDIGKSVATWVVVGALNGAVNFLRHQKERPDEEEDKTSWLDLMSKRFGYTELNDNWTVALPLFSRIAQTIKPISEAVSAENYGPLEKTEAALNGLAKQLIKNKIHNGGQFIMSAFTGKTFKGLPALEQDSGLNVAVANDVRAPFYFHPAGYLFPQQSRLAMDTMTLAHQRAYYDDLLKLALFAEAAKQGTSIETMIASGSVPNVVKVNKNQANELWWKGTVPRLLGFNIMYEPKGYRMMNKQPIQFGDSTMTFGRFAYMIKDWYDYPNLFEVMRKEPQNLFTGWPVKDPSNAVFGIAADESQSREKLKEKFRLPLDNVTRALIQYNGQGDNEQQ